MIRGESNGCGPLFLPFFRHSAVSICLTIRKFSPYGQFGERQEVNMRAGMECGDKSTTGRVLSGKG